MEMHDCMGAWAYRCTVLWVHGRDWCMTARVHGHMRSPTLTRIPAAFAAASNLATAAMTGSASDSFLSMGMMTACGHKRQGHMQLFKVHDA